MMGGIVSAGFAIALRKWEESKYRKLLAESRKPIYSIQCCHEITEFVNTNLFCSRYTYSRVKELLCSVEWISNDFPFLVAYNDPNPWAEWQTPELRDLWISRLEPEDRTPRFMMTPDKRLVWEIPPPEPVTVDVAAGLILEMNEREG